MASPQDNLNDASSYNQAKQNLKSQFVVGNGALSSVPDPETSSFNPSIPSTWSGYNLTLSSTEQPEGQSEDVGTSKLVSVVWQHMRRVTVNGDLMAVCKYCNRKLSARKGSGTKHLLSHLDCCLRKKIGFLRKAYQKEYVARRKSDGQTTIRNCTVDQAKSTRFLVEIIILLEYPLSLVGQLEFQKIVQSLQPLFHIPSRSMVMTDVIELYKEHMNDTMLLLNKNESRVSITTDMWIADDQKKSYMAVTAHFIDDSWQLQWRLLRFTPVPTPHTMDVINEHLLSIILDWNLQNKLLTITMNNGSVNDGVVESVVQKLDNDQLLLGGSVLRMRCCAHMLNLIIKDAFDIIGPSLENIRGSCVYWSSTPKRLKNFEKAAHQLGIASTRNLCCDDARRNSTKEMLETAISYKNVFHHLKKCDSQYKTAPSEEDWENAKMISEKLEVFFNVTELCSGNTTANDYYPYFCDIMVKLSKWLLDSNPTIVNMASRIFEKFDKYWSEVHGIMGIAAILDPRFKALILEYYFEKLYGATFSSEVNKVVDLCRKLFHEYHRRSKQDDEASSGEDEQIKKRGLMSRWELFLQESRKRQKIQLSNELDRYLEEFLQGIPNFDAFDVLGWWKVNGCRYPILQKLARDIYAVPVSTGASESIFSMGDKLVCPQRNRLHPQLVEAFACAQNWLRS